MTPMLSRFVWHHSALSNCYFRREIGLSKMNLISASSLSLLSAAFVNAAYSSTASNNIAVYWGQNSAGGTNTQRSLIQVCRDEPDVDIILLAFLTSAANIDGGLNFANSYRPTEDH
ncbi:hypothetical protein F4860DRAFT_48380 [Xylaria cubensis]|nr:hypothetical protein F4860DRAFT_48380 [Xylaria cubensis]